MSLTAEVGQLWQVRRSSASPYALVYDGVLSRVSSKAGTKCRGTIDGNDQPQALWVFSADVCGTYGFADVTIAHAGRSNPTEEITLISNSGKAKRTER